ncbi:MAG: HEAT repeat domain-containing protein, partial [Anaerolineae bacterium]|nr:HEAT repeat domain-containing protein [Anaerolineae bacterium]
MESLVDEILTKTLPREANTQRERLSRGRRHPERLSPIEGTLIELLKDPDYAIQEGAAFALGQYHSPQVIQELGRRLYPTECEHPQVRKTVAESLGQTNNPNAIPFLKIG